MVTTYPSANAVMIAITAPITRASPVPATIAQIRRNGPGRRYSGTVVSAMPIGSQRRRRVGPRGTRGAALAFLRQPASTRATMANPAIHPA